jgi:hypothetical protein
MLLNSRNKKIMPSQFPGKGHNETLELANSLEQTPPVTPVIQSHVPENGGGT